MRLSCLASPHTGGGRPQILEAQGVECHKASSVRRRRVGKECGEGGGRKLLQFLNCRCCNIRSYQRRQGQGRGEPVDRHRAQWASRFPEVGLMWGAGSVPVDVLFLACSGTQRAVLRVGGTASFSTGAVHG